MRIAIHHGDCLEVIPRLVAESVVCDAVVTDPPYHLLQLSRGGSLRQNNPNSKYGWTEARAGFMGQQWDGGDIAFRPETWATIATIMRPGAFLVAFGGTRTYHRLVCAIEDGGFVVQDTVAWLYGTGFPKNKAQLKPSFEPICLAYKPGGKRTMQVDECRIPIEADSRDVGRTINRNVRATDDGYGFNRSASEIVQSVVRADGRWPANVAHDGSDEVLSAFPESVQPNGRPNCEGKIYSRSSGTFERHFSMEGAYNGGYLDSGSAARFFYAAKADKQDRWGSRHPTVKPIDLIRWLVRLVTPPGGLVLDPFAGSGTTGAAAFAEGRNAILIEREDAYVADIRERMAWCEGEGRHSTAAKARRTEDKPLGGLFDMAPI